MTVEVTERVAPEAPEGRTVIAVTLSLRELGDLYAMRTALRDRLRTVDVPAPRIADVELVATELATNAVVASRPGAPVEVDAHVQRDRIVLEVRNRNGHPADRANLSAPVRMPRANADRGRGLPTVAVLASRLSADIEADQTMLRAELTI